MFTDFVMGIVLHTQRIGTFDLHTNEGFGIVNCRSPLSLKLVAYTPHITHQAFGKGFVRKTNGNWPKYFNEYEFFYKSLAFPCKMENSINWKVFEIVFINIFKLHLRDLKPQNTFYINHTNIIFVKVSGKQWLQNFTLSGCGITKI